MSPTPSAAVTPYNNMPMYGMPQPNTYGQYGFGGYGGFPNQGGAAGGAPGAANPGIPQSAAAGGAGAAMGLGAGMGQAGSDPNAAVVAAQAGQPQWGGADPSSYYSNYWGGYYGQAGQQGTGDVQMQGPQ